MNTADVPAESHEGSQTFEHFKRGSLLRTAGAAAVLMGAGVGAYKMYENASSGAELGNIMVAEANELNGRMHITPADITDPAEAWKFIEAGILEIQGKIPDTLVRDMHRGNFSPDELSDEQKSAIINAEGVSADLLRLANLGNIYYDLEPPDQEGGPMGSSNTRSLVHELTFAVDEIGHAARMIAHHDQEPAVLMEGDALSARMAEIQQEITDLNK